MKELKNKKTDLNKISLNTKADIENVLKEGISLLLQKDKYVSWLNLNYRLNLKRFSMNNRFLMWIQKEDVSCVMTYNQWQQYGRVVKSGSKSLKILAPVLAYEKEEGSMFRMIDAFLSRELKNNKEKDYAEYVVGVSKIVISKNRGGLFSASIEGRNSKMSKIMTEEEIKRFIDEVIIGKEPMYYRQISVFDISDTEIPENLWLKEGFDEKDLVLDEENKPIKNKKGYFLVKNSTERINSLNVEDSFNELYKEEVDYKTHDIGELLKKAKQISLERGVNVFEKSEEEDKRLKECYGFYSRKDNTITIRSTENDLSKFSVLVHEMAHSVLHSSDSNKRYTKAVKELQAESIAYIVCKEFGINTEDKSIFYLASYTNDFSLCDLNENMNIIISQSEYFIKKFKEIV